MESHYKYQKKATDVEIILPVLSEETPELIEDFHRAFELEEADFHFLQTISTSTQELTPAEREDLIKEYEYAASQQLDIQMSDGYNGNREQIKQERIAQDVEKIKSGTNIYRFIGNLAFTKAFLALREERLVAEE